MKRFAVKVAREVIVHADDPSSAGRKALEQLAAITREPPASRPIMVIDTVELPEVDKVRVEVDH